MNLIGALWQSLWVVPTGTQDKVPNRESGGFLVVKGLRRRAQKESQSSPGRGGRRGRDSTARNDRGGVECVRDVGRDAWQSGHQEGRKGAGCVFVATSRGGRCLISYELAVTNGRLLAGGAQGSLGPCTAAAGTRRASTWHPLLPLGRSRWSQTDVKMLRHSVLESASSIRANMDHQQGRTAHTSFDPPQHAATGCDATVPLASSDPHHCWHHVGPKDGAEMRVCVSQPDAPCNPIRATSRVARLQEAGCPLYPETNATATHSSSGLSFFLHQGNTSGAYNQGTKRQGRTSSPSDENL